MQQLTGAVHALHLSGIIHRNLKPENVFVTKDGRVKVLDLGAAKFRCSACARRARTKTIGTPPYMSPEHLRGNATINGRSNVYSLGHVFYEVLAKRHAFCGPGESFSGESRPLARATAPEPASVRRPGLPPILDEVVLKALEKRREDRWQSCEELHLATLGVANHLDSLGLLDEPAEDGPLQCGRRSGSRLPRQMKRCRGARRRSRSCTSRAGDGAGGGGGGGAGVLAGAVHAAKRAAAVRGSEDRAWDRDRWTRRALRRRGVTRLRLLRRLCLVVRALGGIETVQ